MRPFIFAVLLVVLVSCLLTLIGLIQVQQLKQLHWSIWIANQFRFQYLLIELVGLVFLAGIGRKYKLFALVVVLCLCLNAAFILPYYSWTKSSFTASDKKAFSVLLSNTGFISDYRPLSNYIHSVKPDIICIVELDPKLRQIMFQGELRREYPFQHVEEGSQLGLYSKFPIVKATLEPPDSQVGPSLNSVLNIGRNKFFLVLSHPVVPYSAAALRKQELHFQKWGRTWQNKSNSLMIVGDMNSVPWSPEFQALLHQTGLKDSAIGFGIQPSWPAEDPLIAIPIDHVLVGERFKVLNRVVGPAVGSDHRPVLVKVAL